MKAIGTLKKHPTGYYYCRLNGKNKYFTPKDITLEEAQRQYDLEFVKVGGTKDNKIDRKDKKVKDLLAIFLQDTKHERGDAGQTSHARHIKGFNDLEGETKVGDLTAYSITSYINKTPVKTTGTGKRGVYATLYAAFNWLFKQDLIDRNPMLAMKRPEKGVRGEEYLIEQEEWDRIVQYLYQPYRDAAQICWESGARPSEILEATCDEWDAEMEWLVKKHHKNEGKGKERVILMPSNASSIVCERIGTRKEGLICPSPKGRVIHVSYFCDAIQVAGLKAGRKKPLCTYSTRHSWCVRQIAAGFTLHQIAVWMGNSPEVIQQHYAHAISEFKRKKATIRPV